MFGRISSCFRRHKKKLFILGGVIGGIAFANTYLRRKLLEWESNKAVEYLERMKKARHFEYTMETCDSVLISLSSKIREIVYNAVDVQPIVEKLKQNPPNKVELWDRLKVLVFTQALGEMYAQCLLVVLLRVQICILSGYIYSKNRIGQTLNGAMEDQQKYMSRITTFFVSGIKDLMAPMEDAVTEAFALFPLNRMLMLADFESIISSIMGSVSASTTYSVPHIIQYLMPADFKDSNENESKIGEEFMENILRETKDVLECQDFTRVLLQSIEHGTASVMDRVSECYMFMSNAESKFSNLHQFSAPLAKIIPMMHNVLSQHEPNEQGALVHTLLQQESLKTFAANIYEAFSQQSG